MKPQHALAAAALISAPFCVSAQTMKPGLWDISNKMQTGSGQMEKETAKMQKEMAEEMAGMPPEQRKMMQDMMAKPGVSMSAGSPGAISVKVCMTKEMAERNEIHAQQQGDCKHTTSARSGNTAKIAFACTNPPSSGEGTVTFVSPEAYTMRMTMNTMDQGKPEKMNMDGSGKWLSADCGSIKPPAARRK